MAIIGALVEGTAYHNITVTHNISANSNAKSTSAIFTLSRHHTHIYSTA